MDKHKSVIDCLSNLAEIQTIKIQDEKNAFTALKFSHDGKYLAAGTENGRIYIFECINIEYLLNKKIYPNENNNTHNFTYKLINENYFKYSEEQTNKIVDICWSFKVKFFIYFFIQILF